MKCNKIFSYIQIFFLVIGIVMARVMVEWWTFAFPIQLGVVQDCIRFSLENIYYFLILFFVGSVFVSKIINKDLKQVMNTWVRFYPVIILPPLIDYFIIGRTEGYYYLKIKNIVINFFTGTFLSGDATLGVGIGVLISLIGVFLYVYIHTKNIWKALASFVFFDLFIVLTSTPALIFGEKLSSYYFDHFLPLYYFFPFLFILIIFLRFEDKNKFRAVSENLRGLGSLIFVCAVLAGGSVCRILVKEFYVLNLFLGVSAVFLAWQVFVIINHIFDIPIDGISNVSGPLVKNIVTISEYKLMAVLLSFLTLSFAIVINLRVFVYMVIFLILAYTYSAPPLRLRRNFLGNFVIGMALVLSFLTGIEASRYPNSTASINFLYQLGFLSTMIFLFGATASLAKDIKNIERDKEHGVKNLFTIFGKKKGKIIVMAGLWLVFNFPTLISKNIFFVLLSSLAVLIYYKFESIKAACVIGVLIVFCTIFYPV